MPAKTVKSVKKPVFPTVEVRADVAPTDLSTVRIPVAKILAVDPGEETGWCVLHVYKTPDVSATIHQYGYWKIDTDSTYMGDWCLDLREKVRAAIHEFEITEIYVEDYFFNKKTPSGSNVNPAYRAAVHMISRELNLHYEVLSITHWKHCIMGKSRPSPEEKKKWGVADSQKWIVVEALSLRHGIDLPAKLEGRTKNGVRCKFDIADAIGQGIYGCFLLHNVRTVNLADHLRIKVGEQSLLELGEELAAGRKSRIAKKEVKKSDEVVKSVVKPTPKTRKARVAKIEKECELRK